MSSSTESEIWDNVNNAREAAVQNKYEDSQVFYNGAIEQVKRYLASMDSGDSRSKWTEVRLCQSVGVTEMYFHSSF